MARDPKKPKPTPEESQAALLKLTSGVASISHFGIKGPPASPLLAPAKPAVPATVPALPELAASRPANAPVVEPAAPAETAAVEAASRLASIVTPPASVIKPVPPQEEQKGENDGGGEGEPAPGPAAALEAAPEAVSVEPVVEVAAAEPDATQADLDESSDGEGIPAADVTGPALATTPGEYDLSTIFVRSKAKKTFLSRITPDNQEFFNNLGTMLGAGTSAPDIIHNILMQWRASHEGLAQKAMQKRLRQLITKKH